LTIRPCTHILLITVLLSRAITLHEEVILVIPSLQVDYLATGQTLVQ
jgi:hypothetical protein